MNGRFIIIVLAGLCMFSAFSQHLPQDKNWEVIFQDDFSTFDTAQWVKHHNHTHGEDKDEEPQIYDTNDVYIENGKLVLRTQKLNNYYPCPKGAACYYGGKHYYTSGEIGSNASYRYGYFEIYAKLPVFSRSLKKI
jgi:beta-glucanase (GH16 family)